MGLFEHWPYTNFHELNLDIIVMKMQEVLQAVQNEELAIDQLQQAVNELKLFKVSAENQLSKNSDQINANKIQIQQALDLCNQILEILSDQGVNPNIGYLSNFMLDNAAMQMMYNAMMSYQTSAWDIAGNNIEYGNYLTNNPLGTAGTPLDPVGTFTQYNRLDCAAFTILCLMGVPFQSTGFKGTNNITPRTNFNRNYKYKPTRNPDGLLRWASDIYEIAETNEMLIEITDPSQVRTGDVMFWKYTDAAWAALPDTDFAKQDGGAYKHVAHCGILVDSCTAFGSGVGLMQCVDTLAVMDFRDVTSYNPTSLEVMPYVMRPYKLKAKGWPVYSGFTVFRKKGSYSDEMTLGQYEIDHQTISYSGGRIPANYTTYGIDSSTGAVDTSITDRIVTDFIPYNGSLVVENDLTGTHYKVYYYNAAGNYIGYTDNTITRPFVNAVACRIEFYNTYGTGELTASQVTYLLGHVIIRYHIMAEDYASLNTGEAQNTTADTYYMFTDDNLFIPYVNV